MRRVNLLLLALLALLLLSGCESVNSAVVRHWFKDPGLSRRMKHQIEEGLERREVKPPVTGPRQPAPPFMDQGKFVGEESDKT